jgi:uncharacterized coiled-coil protein SlyX
LRLELANAKSNIHDAEVALASQKAQLEKLNHVVTEADAGAYALPANKRPSQWQFDMKLSCDMPDAEAGFPVYNVHAAVCGRMLCAERWRQKKELDLVLGERDILGTQLIRRNDELALLYEKVKIQQSTLSRGQIQYKDR